MQVLTLKLSPSDVVSPGMATGLTATALHTSSGSVFSKPLIKLDVFSKNIYSTELPLKITGGN